MEQAADRLVETQTTKAYGDTRRDLQKQLEISGLLVKGDAWSVLVDGYNYGHYTSLRDFADRLTEVLFAQSTSETFIDRAKAEQAIRLLDDQQKTPPETIDNQPSIQIRSVATEACAQVTNLPRTNFKHHHAQLASALQKMAIFESGQFRLTPLDYLNSYESSVDCRCVVLALLKRNPLKDNEFTLEDGSGKLAVAFEDVDFREMAIFLDAIYLIEGAYNGVEDVFHIASIGLPPPVTDVLATTTNKLELPNDPLVVIVNDVHLDRPDVIDRLRYLFSGYDACEEVPEMFVFSGDFLSCSGLSVDRLREHLRRLFRLISTFSHLTLKSHFIFLPGPRDLNRLETFVEEKMPKEIIEAGQIRNISLATNPAFLHIYGRRLVFYTEPVLSRLSKNMIHSAHECADLRQLAREEQQVIDDHLTAIARLLVVNAHLTAGQCSAFAEPLTMFPRAPDRILISNGKTKLDHQHVSLFDDRVHMHTLPSFTLEDGKFVAYYVGSDHVEQSQVTF